MKIVIWSTKCLRKGYKRKICVSLFTSKFHTKLRKGIMHQGGVVPIAFHSCILIPLDKGNKFGQMRFPFFLFHQLGRCCHLQCCMLLINVLILDPSLDRNLRPSKMSNHKSKWYTQLSTHSPGQCVHIAAHQAVQPWAPVSFLIVFISTA